MSSKPQVHRIPPMPPYVLLPRMLSLSRFLLDQFQSINLPDMSGQNCEHSTMPFVTAEVTMGSCRTDDSQIGLVLKRT
jgi:hypothetical protein